MVSDNEPVARSDLGATPYVPLDGRPWRHSMGLRPLDEAAWFEFGDDADEQLAEKTRLLASSRSDVLALTDWSDDARVELFAAVTANLATFHPARRRVSAPEDDPLVAASRLVPADLCLLQRHGGSFVLSAACVCFPSRWRLADKIGTSLDAIHSPVPGYGEDLAGPTASFFERLGPSRAFWRLNWTLLDDPALFQPAASRSAPLGDPGRWVFRVERQTLSALAVSGAIVFTIRTYRSRAEDVARANPTFVASVQRVLSSASPATIAYKGWGELATSWARRFDLESP
jgi:hypothetical protein